MALGLERSGGDATFFVWLRTPGGEDAEAWALRLLDERGIAVAPGPYFGPGGAGHVRVALVPTLRGLRAGGRAAGRVSVATPRLTRRARGP